MAEAQNVVDDDAPLDPAAMLALSQREQYRVDTIATGSVVWMIAVWGIAWFVGFLVLWASKTDVVGIPDALAGTIFGALIIGAMGASWILGARISRGIKRSSSFVGIVYGLSWPIAGTAVGLLGVALQYNGMPSSLSFVFYPAAYSLMVGLLYISGAAIWQSPAQFILGMWILIVGIAAPFAGYPTNLLVMALAGGGGFLLGAVRIAIVVRMGRTRVPRG
jgi:hypothetical protein